MQISRKLSRKILFQRLFAQCFNDTSKQVFESSFFEGKFQFDIDEKYIDDMYSLILEKEGYLHEIIKLYAPKFDVKNMHLSYVLPIFIGSVEMLYYPEEIPAKVSINESIELAKMYGDDSAKKIVNGVLNKIFENLGDLEKQLGNIMPNTSFSLFVK